MEYPLYVFFQAPTVSHKKALAHPTVPCPAMQGLHTGAHPLHSRPLW